MGASLTKTKRVEPNPGPQEVFLSTPADIAIYGGKPGGGKTFALLFEGARHYANPKYNGLIIRRIREDLTKIGGIWSASKSFYAPFKTKENNSDLVHTFPSGGVLGFGSMRDATKDHERYKSTEFDFVGFEEIFGEDGNGIEEHQFWFMWTRCRGAQRSHIKSYMRGTSNPGPSWLFHLLKGGGFVGEDGFAVESMSGVIRWFYRDEDSDLMLWFDSKEEAEKDIIDRGLDPKDTRPFSFTFILASADDNPYQDEDYTSKLSNLKRVERERQKYGNWAIETEEGDFFKRHWWGTSTRLPKLDEFAEVVRAWDLAATKLPKPGAPNYKKNKNKKPAYTAGILMGRTKTSNRIWIMNIKRFRGTPAEVRAQIKATADQDREMFPRVTNTIPLDPGAGGVSQLDSLFEALAGHKAKKMDTIGDKPWRAEGFSSSVENGLVSIYIDQSNPENNVENFINEGALFPFGEFKDMIDAASDGHDHLMGRTRKKSSFAR